MKYKPLTDFYFTQKHYFMCRKCNKTSNKKTKKKIHSVQHEQGLRFDHHSTSPDWDLVQGLLIHQ